MIFPFLSSMVNAQHIRLVDTGDNIVFLEEKDTILVYQASAKSLAGKFERVNYIHPLYSLDGDILTQDFPKDHLHHRGIFWAWHQIYIGDKSMGDGWELKDMHWQVRTIEFVQQADGASGIKVNVDWLSPKWTEETGLEVPFIMEETRITARPKKKNHRFIDVEVKLFALEPDVSLGGSEDEKGYGGFSPRFVLPEDVSFTGPGGNVEPKNTPVKSEGWIDVSGTFGESQKKTGVAIFAHPDNPGFPNPWILRKKASMQNAVYPYPGRRPVVLLRDEPLVLRYRLVVHDPGVDLNKLYRNYK